MYVHIAADLTGENDTSLTVTDQRNDAIEQETRELEMDCDELKKRIEQARADKVRS